MIDTLGLERQIADILATVTDKQILKQEQSQVSFTDTYVTFKLQNLLQQGQNENKFTNNTDFTSKTLWKVTLNICCIGATAMQEALQIAHRLTFPSVLNAFDKIPMGLLSVDQVKHVPRLLGTGWEQRYLFDSYFTLMTTDVDTATSWIEHVQTTETYTNENDDVIYTNTKVIDLVP